METPQTFPTQAAKDAALLELAEWLIDNSVMKFGGNVTANEWYDLQREYIHLKFVPVEPAKSAEEVLCEFICLEYYELAERSDQHIMTPNEALKAMHQYAAQSVK